MLYRATEFFQDKTDGLHKYYAGDTFPREGLTVSEERLAELSSNRNVRRRPVIAAVAEASADAEPKKEQKKRSRKKV